MTITRTNAVERYEEKEEIMEAEKIRISLAAARVNAKLTQEDVAKEMQVSKNKVVNWESGRQEPTISQARRLSDLYRMPLDYIFLPAKSN